MVDSRVLMEVAADISPYERSMRNLRLSTHQTTQFVKSSWLAAAAGVYALVKVWDLAKLGARAEQERASFENLANSYGVNAKKMLSDLKSASGDTIDQMNLINKAGTAMMMGIDPTKLSKLMEIARATSRITGLTVAESFDKIALAVAKQSSIRLNDTGIIIDQDKANKEYAKSINKTVEQMSKADKQMAFLNATVKTGEKLIKRLGGEANTAAENVQTFEAAMSDLKTELAIALVPTLSSVAQKTAEAIEGFRIFFGLGEENKLRKQLTSVIGDLEKVENDISYLKKVKTGEIIDNLLYDPREIQKRLDKAEEQRRKLDIERIKINKQMQSLYVLPGGVSTVPKISDGEETEDKDIDKRKRKLDELEVSIKRLQMTGDQFDLWEVQEEIKKLAIEYPGDTGMAEKANELYLATRMSMLKKTAEEEEQNEIHLQNALAAIRKKVLGEEEEDEKKAILDKENLRKGLAESINRYRLSEVEYNKWALEQEIKDMRARAGDDLALQAQITENYKLALQDIEDKGEETFGENMKNAVTGWASDFSKTLTDMVWGADLSFKSIARSFGMMITQIIIQKQIVDKMMGEEGWFNVAVQAIGAWFSGPAAAHGRVFAGAGIGAYENQIITKPTVVPLARGAGLIGEAGLEAVLPLTRTRSGNLGVEAVTGSQETYLNIDIHDNLVYDENTMMNLVTRVSTAVTQKVAPDAVFNNYMGDGKMRALIRNRP